MPSQIFCDRCGREIFTEGVPLDGKWFHSSCAMDHVLAVAIRVSGRDSRVQAEAEIAVTWGDVYATMLVTKESLREATKPFGALLTPRVDNLCQQITPLLVEEMG